MGARGRRPLGRWAGMGRKAAAHGRGERIAVAVLHAVMDGDGPGLGVRGTGSHGGDLRPPGRDGLLRPEVVADGVGEVLALVV